MSTFIFCVLLCCSRKKSLWDLFITVICLGRLSLSKHTKSNKMCKHTPCLSLRLLKDSCSPSHSFWLSFSPFLSFHRRGKRSALLLFFPSSRGEIKVAAHRFSVGSHSNPFRWLQCVLQFKINSKASGALCT